MVAILQGLDVDIRVLKIEKPGYRIYEDEFQIVAEPVADNRRRLL